MGLPPHGHYKPSPLQRHHRTNCLLLADPAGGNWDVGGGSREPLLYSKAAEEEVAAGQLLLLWWEATPLLAAMSSSDRKQDTAGSSPLLYPPVALGDQDTATHSSEEVERGGGEVTNANPASNGGLAMALGWTCRGR
ncbi:UNVERIFIED_CONTAM: hypothetical protein K2H54_034424 [Gekko kuhli]